MFRIRQGLAGRFALIVAIGSTVAVTSPALAANGDIHTFAGYSVGQMQFGADQAFMYAPGPRGDGGPAVDAALSPRDVAFDAAGNAYIADAGDNRIRKVDSAGIISTFVETNAPIALAISPADEIYWVSEADHRVYRWHTNAFGFPGVEPFAGSGVTVFSGDGGPAVAAGMDPIDIAFDPAGNLIVVDAGNHRLRRVTPSGTITTFAGTGGTGMSGDYVLCTSDAGDGGPATAARICNPSSVAIDSAGRVYLTTRPYAGHIRRIETNGIISNYLGTGECVIYMSLGVTRQNATPCMITDVAVDSHNNVYVSVPRGFFVPYILRVDAFNGLVTRIAGKGCGYTAGGGYYIGCYAGDDGPALMAGLDNPIGVIARPNGTLYFADSRNLRVRTIEPFGYPSVNPLALSFSATEVNVTSAPLTAFVRNTGSGSLTLGAAALEGADAAAFTIGTDGCAGLTLAPGGTCQIGVTFKPLAAGAKTAFIHVPSSGPEAPESRFGITLSGTGVTIPRLAVSPSPLAFGNKPVGSSTTKTVTVSSTGSAPVSIGSLSVSGMQAASYLIASDTCSGVMLAPGSSCVVDVTFTPPVKGFHNATLTIPTATFTSAVQLVGSAGPLISVTPGSLSFGEIVVGSTSAPQAITAKNTGADPLLISGASLAGPDAGQFSLATDGCSGAVLAPGATCAIDVSFGPTALGLAGAALRIASDAPTPTVDVVLHGTGIEVAPPVTTFTNGDGDILVGLIDGITGGATDNLSGVASVQLTLTPMLGSERTVTASLTCNADRTSCTWRASLPLTLVGPVVVRAQARDRAGNLETPGPTIAILVL